MNYIAVIVAIFGIDFFLKNHVEETLRVGQDKKKAKGWLILHKHHNKGAFLNIGEGKQRLVAWISLLLTLVLTLFFIITLGMKGKGALKTGLTFLLGGAFSNTYDRWKRGYVVDYISFGVKWKWLRNIIFNVSDFFIIIGAFITAIFLKI